MPVLQNKEIIWALWVIYYFEGKIEQNHHKEKN